MKRPSNIIKIGEACEILGVHPNTLRRWEREGKVVPHVRTAGVGTRYYNREEILAMVDTKADQYLTWDQMQELVGVELSEGTIGWGTGPAYYSRETIEQNMELIREYHTSLNS